MESDTQFCNDMEPSAATSSKCCYDRAQGDESWEVVNQERLTRLWKIKTAATCKDTRTTDKLQEYVASYLWRIELADAGIGDRFYALDKMSHRIIPWQDRNFSMTIK